jgi:hypothetical protein
MTNALAAPDRAGRLLHQPALPAIAEPFTIGRVLVQSWRAFVAGWRRFMPIVVAISALAIFQSWLDRETDMYGSAWAILSAAWISSAIQSLTFAPTILGVLDPARSESMVEVGYWTRALKIVIATLVLQIAVCWPMAATIAFATTWESSFLGYGIFLFNAVAIGALFTVYFPVFLVERCSLWTSAHRGIRQVLPHIWRMAAISMLYWLIYLAAGTMVAMAAAAAGASETDWLYYAGWWPVQIFLLLAGNITSAVSYRLLRIEREGPDPAHVAGVFE